MPIFGSAGREENRGEGARASSAWQGDGTEPAPVRLFPGFTPGFSAPGSPHHPWAQQPACASACPSL